jgi:hypothetical protein
MSQSISIETSEVDSHPMSQIDMPSIETDEALTEINFRNNSGGARKRDLAEDPFSV